MNTKIALTISLSCLAATVHGAEIYQTVQGSDSQHWGTAIWGDPASVRITEDPDNIYVTDGSTSASAARSGNYSNSGFGNNTLKLINGAGFVNKAQYVNEANFILEGNSSLSAGDQTGTYGNTFTSSTTIFVDAGQSGQFNAGPAARKQRFASFISGSGTINAVGEDATTINYIQQSGNTFSGLWTVSTSTLASLSDGSFGTGSFLINDGGVLDISYEFRDATSTSTLTIETGGLFQLNSGITSYFNSITLNGIALDAGTYTFSDLDAGKQAFFTDIDGTGSFTVVPEPTTTALMIGSLLLGFTLIRRRK
ncbi:MAG TPA: hypothetical protein DEA90_15870 [Opitutae bacterium]|nr:hypothetical protein [Puniceicoccaceae bacterium]HBR95637.1 hypothetical protein [Opitutae bacterium]|tara:strand:+ start:12725 stop:13654 length:930 start_codon:yes stop_codon:yes gene_type:complete